MNLLSINRSFCQTLTRAACRNENRELRSWSESAFLQEWKIAVSSIKRILQSEVSRLTNTLCYVYSRGGRRRFIRRAIYSNCYSTCHALLLRFHRNLDLTRFR